MVPIASSYLDKTNVHIPPSRLKKVTPSAFEYVSSHRTNFSNIVLAFGFAKLCKYELLCIIVCFIVLVFWNIDPLLPFTGLGCSLITSYRYIYSSPPHTRYPRCLSLIDFPSPVSVLYIPSITSFICSASSMVSVLKVTLSCVV